MKFICSKFDLERAFISAERFTGKNLTLPVLGSVLLEVKGEKLFLTATNLEYAIQIILEGSGAKEGRVCVPAKIASSFLQSVREDEIQIEERQGNLEIKTAGRETRVNGVSAEDFPLIPTIKKTHSFTLNGFEFKRGLERVLPAVSFSEFKPELSGVYCHITPHEGRVAATDTFRLAEQVIGPGKGIKETTSFILPHRLAQEFVRVVGDAPEVAVMLGENQIMFECGGIKIISRLIEGNFPEYQAIIPKKIETSCYLKKEDLMGAVRTSSIFSSKLQDVGLRITSKEVEIAAANQEVGNFKTSIPAAVSGNEVSLHFNYRYLLDGLNVIDEGEFYLGVNSENSPSVIKNKNDASFTYVVMPIRIS